jgi:hypothetical protein
MSKVGLSSLIVDARRYFVLANDEGDASQIHGARDGNLHLGRLTREPLGNGGSAAETGMVMLRRTQAFRLDRTPDSTLSGRSLKRNSTIKTKTWSCR